MIDRGRSTSGNATVRPCEMKAWNKVIVAANRCEIPSTMKLAYPVVTHTPNM